LPWSDLLAVLAAPAAAGTTRRRAPQRGQQATEKQVTPRTAILARAMPTSWVDTNSGEVRRGEADDSRHPASLAKIMTLISVRALEAAR